MNEISITLESLKHIIDILNNTETKHCTITQDNSSGIGRVTNVEVFLKYNGISGIFRVNIEDENNW